MKKQIDIYKFATKNDRNRPALNGVFHDGEKRVAVATNLRVMLASSSAYDETRAGEIVGRNGETIEGRFPKWAAVIPTRNTNTFPMDQLREAVRRADNFLKNAPATDKNGAKIRKDARTIYLAIRAEGKDWAGEFSEFLIGVSYDVAKLVCALPADGAVVTFEDRRHTILYKNEAEGLTALFMPVLLDPNSSKVVVKTGIFNTYEAGEKIFGGGLYLNTSVISAVGTSEEAEKLFRTPEKPAPRHFVKTIEPSGEIKKRLDSSIKPLEGFNSYFFLDQRDSDCLTKLYMRDGVMYIQVASARIVNGRASDSINNQIRRFDGVGYAETCAALGKKEGYAPLDTFIRETKGAGVSATTA